MRGAATLVGMILCSTMLFADDQKIDFDLHFDFSKVSTFRVREGNIASTGPEINDTLVKMKIRDAIRTELLFKGLRESSVRSDVVVEFSISHVNYSGRASNAQSADPVASAGGSLVIDMTADNPGTLIWRGVYHDSEKDSSRFSEKLPSDARNLLSEYPPKKKP